MAQHDYDIANQSGANFRTDLNNALDAIVSNNSGSSAPSTTFAYEWWIDTTNNLLKLRNSANNAWITLPLSITADNATSGALTVNGNLTTTGTVDINGQELILDADADTSITADTDDQIDFKIGGTDVATLTAGTLKVVNTGNTETLILESTDADSSAGPVLEFYRNSSSPADNDAAGLIYFTGENDADEKVFYGQIYTQIKDASDGSEDASITFYTMAGGASTAALSLVSGSVGIGTTSPAYKLDVVHDNVGEGTVAQFGGDGGAGSIPDVRIVNSNQSSGSTDEGARIIFQLGNTNACFIQAFKEADGTSAGNRSGGVAFYTSNANSVTEKMRLTAAGQLLVGLTAASGSSSAVLQARGTGAAACVFDRTTDGVVIGFKRNGGSDVGSISITSTSTAFNTSSDYRLKENINYEFNALSAISKLKPARFNFISDKDVTLDGFLAHEVSDVVPIAITGKKDGEEMQSIDHSKLVPLLTKGIQEQQSTIEDLKARLETLEG